MKKSKLGAQILAGILAGILIVGVITTAIIMIVG